MDGCIASGRKYVRFKDIMFGVVKIYYRNGF